MRRLVLTVPRGPGTERCAVESLHREWSRRHSDLVPRQPNVGDATGGRLTTVNVADENPMKDARVIASGRVVSLAKGNPDEY